MKTAFRFSKARPRLRQAPDASNRHVRNRTAARRDRLHDYPANFESGGSLEFAAAPHWGAGPPI
jgi:hypothetical protein